MKKIFKDAMRWARYQGNDHGMPGGIAIDPKDALKAVAVMADMYPGYQPSNGVDKLAKKEPGMNCRDTNIFLQFRNFK